MKSKIVITEFLMNKFLFLMLLMMVLTSSSFSQSSKKAQVGFRFLENPVSAEVVGRGMVGVVNTVNSEAIFWNPALTGLIEASADVAFNHTRGIADINYNGITAAIKAGDFGVVGFSLMAMDYGTFYRTVRDAGENGYIETGEFSPSALSAGISFSQQVTSRFSYGIHIKYAYQDLGEAWVSNSGDSLNDPNFTRELKAYNKGTVAADVGAFYDFQYNGIKFGAVLQNISRELRYEQQEFPLPFSVNFGASVEPLLFMMDRIPDHQFTLNFETKHPRDFGEKFKIGGEYNFARMLFVRAGYSTNYDERGWSAGLGFNYDVSNVPLRLNYAIQPYGIFGNVHFISVGISYK